MQSLSMHPRGSALAGLMLSAFIASPVWSADELAIRSAQTSAAPATAATNMDPAPEETCKVRKRVHRGAPGKSVPAWRTRVVPCEKT
jgi:hypothetical protein